MPTPHSRTFSNLGQRTVTTKSFEDNLFELFVLTLRGDPKITCKKNGVCEVVTTMFFSGLPLTFVIQNTSPDKIRALSQNRKSQRFGTERDAIITQLKAHFAKLLNLPVEGIENDLRVNQLLYHIWNLGAASNFSTVLNGIKKPNAELYTAATLDLTKPNYLIKRDGDAIVCVEPYTSKPLETSFTVTTTIRAQGNVITSENSSLKITDSSENKSVLQSIAVKAEEDKAAEALGKQPDVAIRKLAPTGLQILWDGLTKSTVVADARFLATALKASCRPADDLLGHMIAESKSSRSKLCRWITGTPDPLETLLASQVDVADLIQGLQKDNKQSSLNLLKELGEAKLGKNNFQNVKTALKVLNTPKSPEPKPNYYTSDPLQIKNPTQRPEYTEPNSIAFNATYAGVRHATPVFSMSSSAA